MNARAQILGRIQAATEGAWRVAAGATAGVAARADAGTAAAACGTAGCAAFGAAGECTARDARGGCAIHDGAGACAPSTAGGRAAAEETTGRAAAGGAYLRTGAADERLVPDAVPDVAGGRAVPYGRRGGEEGRGAVLPERGPSGLRMRSCRPRADVVALFAERVAARHGGLRHVAPDELAVAMAAMLWAIDARRVAVPADLPRGWLADLRGTRLLSDEPPLDAATLAACDVAVTGCRLAIAETGTVVLDGGRGQGHRALTLLPAHHVCVVHADQIVGTVREAIDRLDPYRPQTWLSDAPTGGPMPRVLLVEG